MKGKELEVVNNSFAGSYTEEQKDGVIAELGNRTKRKKC
jgi:hypothetical protein